MKDATNDKHPTNNSPTADEKKKKEGQRFSHLTMI